MTEKADRSRRHKPFSGELDNLGHEPQLAWGRPASEVVGNDLVGILTKLTSEVERFDSMIVLHRKVLEQRVGAMGACDDDELSRRSELSLDAADMVTCARQALEQLRRLGKPTQPLTLNGSHRNRARGLAKDRRQG